MKERRDDERDGGQNQHGDLGARRNGVELLELMLEAPSQKRGAQHQEDITDDRARKRGFDDVDKAGAQGHDGDDQLEASPEDAFSRPPMPSPVRSAMCWVASPANPPTG